jgi:hypothetical protein
MKVLRFVAVCAIAVCCVVHVLSPIITKTVHVEGKVLNSLTAR